MAENKQAIVPLSNPKFPKKISLIVTLCFLLLNLKSKDLELNFYSSLDSEVMTKILDKVLP